MPSLQPDVALAKNNVFDASMCELRVIIIAKTLSSINLSQSLSMTMPCHFNKNSLPSILSWS